MLRAGRGRVFVHRPAWRAFAGHARPPAVGKSSGPGGIEVLVLRVGRERRHGQSRECHGFHVHASLQFESVSRLPRFSDTARWYTAMAAATSWSPVPVESKTITSSFEARPGL